jgi:hypothetical protein
MSRGDGLRLVAFLFAVKRILLKRWRVLADSTSVGTTLIEPW